MWNQRPPLGAGKRQRSDLNMPGINENYTNQMNKKNRGMENKSGRPNPDTPQNVISTTTIMLAPPRAPDELTTDDQCYAPASLNPLADTPSRGDWAVCAPYNQDWLARSVAMNTYSNALPVFTNMARVPKGTKIRFAGLVGNAGMGKQGDESADNFGQVYSAGALSGRNTGPEYIPPLSHVYLSPYAYVRKDAKTGKPFPGYTDPGWDAVKCDKYQPAVHALRDADVSAYFHAIEGELREAAKKDDCLNPGKCKSILSGLEIHEHVPVFLYAKHFLFQARADELMKGTLVDQKDRDAVLKVFNLILKETKTYWKETEEQQKQITNALGGPQWDTRRQDVLDVKDFQSSVALDLYKAYTKLLVMSTEIFKAQFAEQGNFIRSLVFGKSRSVRSKLRGSKSGCGCNLTPILWVIALFFVRYGCPSEGQLDVMVFSQQFS